MSAHINQITSTLANFCAAWKTNDGAAVASFFVEDGTIINPFGQRADGRAAVAAMYTEYFGGRLGGTTTAFDLASARPVGADHALVDAVQPIRAPDGSPVLVVHLTALMRKDGGAWRFVDARPYTFASPA